jgi:hypothetical protein
VFQDSDTHDRPHEALAQRLPVSVHIASPRPWDGRLREPDYALVTLARRVRSNGEIKWRGEVVFLSVALVGEPAGLTPVDADRWELRYGPILLARMDTRGRLVPADPPSPPQVQQQQKDETS